MSFILVLIAALIVTLGAVETSAAEQLVTIEQKIEPMEVLVKGGVGEQPQTATVTLTLASPPAPVPVDLVLVLDRSRSVSLKTVKKIAKRLIKHLSAQDRVGLVSFADSATLDMGLTQDRKMLESVIEGLTKGRETALGEALAEAVDELIANGRAEALKVIFLPTDGLRTLGQEPLPQARRAAENNIKIFPIGLSKNVKRSLLSQIAEITGGAFFNAFNDHVLEKIFKKLLRPVVARYISIVETLSPGINFEGNIENPPKVVHKTKRGTTILEWSHSILFAGGVWTASFAVSASATGTLALNQEPSKISFLGPDGKRMTQSIPISQLTVKSAATATASNAQGASQTQEEDLKQKIKELEQRLAALEQKVEELGQKVEALDLEAIKQEIENLKAQLGALLEIPGRLEELEQKLEELAQRVEAPETEALRQDLESVKAELNSLSRHMNTAIEDVKTKLAELEKKLAEQPPPVGALNTATIVTLIILVFLVLASFVAYEWLRRKQAILLSTKAAQAPPKALAKSKK